MRPLGRSIPWKSISIPWIRRSKGWKFRSKATFRRKNGVDLCHIVAKNPFSGVRAAGHLTDVSEHQTFLIFAYLRAKARAHENNRFSVLKNSGFRRGGRNAAPPKPSERVRRDLSRLTRSGQSPASTSPQPMTVPSWRPETMRPGRLGYRPGRWGMRGLSFV